MKALCTLPKVGPNGKDAAKKSKQIKCVIESTQNVLHSTLLSVRNAGGFSALHLAAQNGHNQSCREMLLAGVDPDVQNNVSDEMIVFDQIIYVWAVDFFNIIFLCIVWRHTIAYGMPLWTCWRNKNSAVGKM